METGLFKTLSVDTLRGQRTRTNKTCEDRANKIDLSERKSADGDEVKILILLAVKSNSSMLSVQEIHSHIAKCVKIPKLGEAKIMLLNFWNA